MLEFPKSLNIGLLLILILLLACLILAPFSSFFSSEVHLKCHRLALVTREGKYLVSNVPHHLLYGTMVHASQIICR